MCGHFQPERERVREGEYDGEEKAKQMCAQLPSRPPGRVHAVGVGRQGEWESESESGGNCQLGYRLAPVYGAP